MCGFAGEVVWRNGPADPDVAARMAAKLAHRGPDEFSVNVSHDRRCAIGFQRLAVIDLPGSAQPMTDAQTGTVLAYNGEIYNYRTLRDQLRRAGAEFSTEGDTEVLLRSWLREGPGAMERLSGMFAFAVYDPANEGTLFLARDRFGQKPLYFAQLDGRVVFASEAKALLAHPMLADAPFDEASVMYYLQLGYVPPDRCVFRNIAKVRVAGWAQFDASGHQEHRYWTPKQTQWEAGHETNPEVDVRTLLGTSVAAHLQSDVPLGLLLSGGIDSSIVAAIAARELGPGRLKTFSAGFDDTEYDETPVASRTARFLGTDHHELRIRADLPETVLRLAEIYDEPFGDSSALPTYLICREARKYVTVALTGDGGDEVFCGYDRYRAMLLGRRLGLTGRLLVRGAGRVIGTVASRHERSRLRRFVRFADGLALPEAARYFGYRKILSGSQVWHLVAKEFWAAGKAVSPAGWFAEMWQGLEAGDEALRAQMADMATYLPGDLLVKTDMASMASSLELRAPFLDPALVEFGLSLPAKLRWRRGRGKALLRRAFRGQLPEEVLNGPKRGFGVPLARWLRGPLRDFAADALMDSDFLGRGIVQPERLAEMLAEHVSGRADHSHGLWAVLMLALWLRRMF